MMLGLGSRLERADSSGGVMSACSAGLSAGFLGSGPGGRSGVPKAVNSRVTVPRRMIKCGPCVLLACARQVHSSWAESVECIRFLRTGCEAGLNCKKGFRSVPSTVS